MKRHLFLWIEGALTAAGALLLLLFRLSRPFAEFFAARPGGAVRRALSFLTGWFPFSLFEIIVCSFVLYALFALVLCVILAVRRLKKRPLRRWMKRCALAVPVTLAIVLQLFALTLAPCYNRESCAVPMGLDTVSVTEEDVFCALETVSGVLGKSAPLLEKNEAGETVGKPLAAVKGDVKRAADAFAAAHPFLQAGGSEVKTFLSSPLMTYTHISGIYGFFTGEANVNVNYPHFIVTTTAAHESCHARGVAPENECNFLAAVMLMETSDPYLQYCGAAFVFDDLAAACRKIDRARTDAVLAKTDPAVFRDYAAYDRFFEPYRQNAASQIASGVNDGYLKSMGQAAGVASYSHVVRLLAAYFR